MTYVDYTYKLRREESFLRRFHVFFNLVDPSTLYLQYTLHIVA